MSSPNDPTRDNRTAETFMWALVIIFVGVAVYFLSYVF